MKLNNFCFEEKSVLSKPVSTIVGPSTPLLNQPVCQTIIIFSSKPLHFSSLQFKYMKTYLMRLYQQDKTEPRRLFWAL